MIAESAYGRSPPFRTPSIAATWIPSPVPMAIRKTIRGEERTPLSGRRDVLICGASFAGLMVARQLAGSGAQVLVLDRYEIGDKQTSACGIPSQWLEAL